MDLCDICTDPSDDLRPLGTTEKVCPPCRDFADRATDGAGYGGHMERRTEAGIPNGDGPVNLRE